MWEGATRPLATVFLNILIQTKPTVVLQSQDQAAQRRILPRGRTRPYHVELCGGGQQIRFRRRVNKRSRGA